MSREEVSRVSDCKPYANVSSTGGLECPYYTFEGRSMNVSFLFNAGGLYRIQLWFYEGESESAAGPNVNQAPALAVQLTVRQQRRLWQRVRAIDAFWESLEEIEPGAVARLATIATARRWEIIFLTRRPGTVGPRDEVWRIPLPVRASRGACAKA